MITVWNKNQKNFLVRTLNVVTSAAKNALTNKEYTKKTVFSEIVIWLKRIKWINLKNTLKNPWILKKIILKIFVITVKKNIANTS